MTSFSTNIHAGPGDHVCCGCHEAEVEGKLAEYKQSLINASKVIHERETQLAEARHVAAEYSTLLAEAGAEVERLTGENGRLRHVAYGSGLAEHDDREPDLLTQSEAKLKAVVEAFTGGDLHGYECGHGVPLDETCDEPDCPLAVVRAAAKEEL